MKIFISGNIIKSIFRIKLNYFYLKIILKEKKNGICLILIFSKRKKKDLDEKILFYIFQFISRIK